MVIKPVYNYGPEPVLEKEDYKITKKSKLRSQDYNKLTYISWLQQQLIAECQVSDWCPPFFSRLKQYQTLNKLDIIAISLFCAIFGKAKYELMLSRTGLSTNTSTLYKYSLFPFFFYHWASRTKNEEDPYHQQTRFVSFLPCVIVWDDVWHLKLKIWQSSHRATLWKIYIGTIWLWCSKM